GSADYRNAMAFPARAVGAEPHPPEKYEEKAAIEKHPVGERGHAVIEEGAAPGIAVEYHHQGSLEIASTISGEDKEPDKCQHGGREAEENGPVNAKPGQTNYQPSHSVLPTGWRRVATSEKASGSHGLLGQR